MTEIANLRDEAMRELISSLSDVHATAPTWCAGWSAHELTAHVAAAAEERANLIEDHLAGRPARPTRSWEVREPPFRAMPDAQLRERLVEHAIRFESSVAALPEGHTIMYTGWAMTAQRLRMHSHSEAVLHRWDLVGDDDVSVRSLSDPAMVSHALAVFDAMPALAEARRSCGRDLVVRPGEGLSVTASGHSLAIDLRPHELPLFLWGRCPSRLRDPNANAETLDDVLQRLLKGEVGGSQSRRASGG
ncbi:maleylpyruvate isomerase N-terminal domain-containing protein [Mycobacterium sp. 1081908.1]|uniref:maleylpyruvate isomerase N-terminal domain-containing protein n=1 Tax=Mycobacterium sp. 1081908.1 TaxID=1834066 RepID=UPI000800E5B7|nr:maleylpyruvate isomerase N-terminal domain-containing protein [Mycobacterium sp. 1081908.1]OBK43752.1 hypothetical protein A5655_16110 [Mycobacterium sp. 1081908.1]